MNQILKNLFLYMVCIITGAVLIFTILGLPMYIKELDIAVPNQFPNISRESASFVISILSCFLTSVLMVRLVPNVSILVSLVANFLLVSFIPLLNYIVLGKYIFISWAAPPSSKELLYTQINLYYIKQIEPLPIIIGVVTTIIYKYLKKNKFRRF